MVDFFKHFIDPFDLETNDSPKLPIAQMLNNSRNVFLK